MPSGYVACFGLRSLRFFFCLFVLFFVFLKVFPEFAFKAIPPFLGMLVEGGMVVTMSRSALEEQVGQNDQSPCLPERDGRQAERGRHDPVPEQHDQPSEQEGAQYTDGDAAHGPR